jgi:two-component system sensor histidine kinase KdpD
MSNRGSYRTNGADAFAGRTLKTWQGYGWVLLAAVAVTVVAAPLANYLDLANIVMLYVLVVVVIAFCFGKTPTVVAVILNVAAFDFFFVPPRFSFAVAGAQHLLTFAAMMATGLVIAHLADLLKKQAAEANLRENRSHDLYEMARLLSGSIADEQIIEAATRFFAHSFHARVCLMIRDRDGSLVVPAAPQQPVFEGIDMAVAKRVFASEGHPDAIARGPFLYVPLKAPMRTRGVLLVAPDDGAVFNDAGQLRQLETVAVLIAIALERIHFVTVAREATVCMEGERLRGGLLAALSHDLRTPLTAILGSAESLQLGGHALRGDQGALVDAIRDQARHTSELVENILEMARLELGTVHLRKDWHSLEEIIGSAINARAPALAMHVVDVQLPSDMPLVECDAILIERVFVNLLENAAKYTPAGSVIRIRARVETDHVRVDMIDSGAGVTPGQEKAIFGKFVRANPVANVPGLGLGLAICQTVVEAHGGRIWVQNLPSGGANFAFTLPRGLSPRLDFDSADIS